MIKKLFIVAISALSFNVHASCSVLSVYPDDMLIIKEKTKMRFKSIHKIQIRNPLSTEVDYVIKVESTLISGNENYHQDKFIFIRLKPNQIYNNDIRHFQDVFFTSKTFPLRVNIKTKLEGGCSSENSLDAIIKIK